MKNLKKILSGNKLLKANGYNKRGFTLVELAVSMLIISLISVMVLANYNIGKRQEALNRSAQRLAVAIRQAQNYALFSRIGACGGLPITPPGGYGVYINADSRYIIFGDCNANHVYSTGNDDLVSSVSVEAGVAIVNRINTSFVFEPPIGKFFIDGSAPTGTTEIILQSTADTAKTKTLKISTNGSVSVQ